MQREFPTPPEAMREEWMGLPWVALEVPHMREAQVQDALLNVGRPAIAPLRAIEVPSCRRRDVKRTVWRPHPAIPGYLFAAAPEGDRGWREMLGTRGVRSVLTVGQRPMLTSAAQIVRHLRSVCEMPDPEPEPPEFTLGQVLKVTGGGWRGQFVEFAGMRGPQADVIAEVFGAPRRVQVSVDRLQAA